MVVSFAIVFHVAAFQCLFGESGVGGNWISLFAVSRDRYRKGEHTVSMAFLSAAMMCIHQRANFTVIFATLSWVSPAPLAHGMALKCIIFGLSRQGIYHQPTRLLWYPSWMANPSLAIRSLIQVVLVL